MKMMELGKLVNIRTGKLDANASDENGLYPFFTCSVTPLKINSYTYDTECVLVAGNGDLNVKYYNGKFDAYQRTYIIETKDSEVLNVKYLYYFLEKYLEKLRSQSIGGVIKYIKLSNLTEAIIPVFSINIQNKIVNVLEKSSVLIEKRQSQITALDELTQSLFLEMFGDPVVNPKNILTKKLEDTGELKRGMSKHRPRNAPELLGGPYPLIQTGDVSRAGLFIEEYKSTYSELGLKQSKIWKTGTLCITIAANIAETSILKFDACFPDSVVGYKPNEQMNTIFVHYWFSFLQKIIERTAPESAQKNINLKILNGLEILQPPIDKQNEFANKVLEIDKQKSHLLKAKDSMEDLYNSLLQKAFKGELFQEQ